MALTLTFLNTDADQTRPGAGSGPQSTGVSGGEPGNAFQSTSQVRGCEWARAAPGESSLTLSRLVSVRLGLTDIFTCYSQIWGFRYRL